MNKKILSWYLVALAVTVMSIDNLIAQVAGSFEKISIKDGLSHNEIWAFEQDKYGYMWIATTDGLNKYDGYSFEIFKNDPYDSTSLPSNLVTYVFEDKYGDLWISSSNGLSKFIRNSGYFKNYQFTNSNREDANFITSVLEDSRGILWISTGDGFKSFDRDSGTFRKYEILREDNVVTVFSNSAFNLIETKNKELIGSSISYGLVKYDYDNKLFIQYKLKNNFQNKLKRQVVFTLLEDQIGNIWYGGRDGLFKINLENLSAAEVLNSLNGKGIGNTGALFETRNRKMWIGTWDEGLFQYDLETKKSVKLPVEGKGFYNFYQDRTGLLWMGTYDEGVIKYNFDRAPFELYTFNTTADQTKPAAMCFEQSKKYSNLIWIGTDNGIYAFDKSNNTISKSLINIPKLPNDTNLRIRDLLETEDGELFLATNNGLINYNLSTKTSQTFSPALYDRESLRTLNVRLLFEDTENRIWVGQNEGLFFLNKDNKSFTRIPNTLFKQYGTEIIDFIYTLRESRKPLLQMIEVGDFAELSKEFVISEDASVIISAIGEGNLRGMFDYGMLLSSEGDTLWSMHDLESTFNASGSLKNRQKIGILNLKKGRYKLFYKSDDSHSVESFNQPAPMDSLYWGIELYSINDKEYKQYSQVLNQDVTATYMTGSFIISMHESSDKSIWVGTDAGLSIIDPKTLEIINMGPNSKNGLSISNNIIQDISEDNAQNIWIATEDGLNRYDRIKNKITVFREREGLPSNSLRALQLDNDGNLWVSTIKGISKVEINDSSKIPIFINYDVRDGLQGYTYFNKASMKDSEGKLYFSGPDGFNVFSPGVTDKSLPSIVLNSLSISNKSFNELDKNLLESVDLNTIEELDLAYDQNDISFEFASIHFARPDKNRLQYKMEGVDEVWHDGSKQIATYGNLDPGEYVFMIRGSNGDGIWNEHSKKIKINISPAWYNNWTAYSIYAALFLGLLYSIRKFEMRRQHKNAQIKESELRIEAAEALAKAAESDKRTLQVEFEHKKKELEEARELQLSMLPKELPQLPNLDIAVYMKTATEVGGDYYDFHIEMDGTLTVVLGDATGHGMKAGTMVTTTKSLFNVLAPNPNIVETFHEMTRCLKLMQMQNLSMCMTMLKVMGNRVQMSAAGMPPIFIYKRESQSAEEHLIKGMPLGTFNNFPYEIIESQLQSGDVILLMSDGLPELVNDENEMFGYKRIRNLFEDIAPKSPEEIIRALKNSGSDWVNDKDPDDDVTFVVIKVK